jgi:RNA polymerase sigma factor (sigma-70 family)
MEPGGTPEIDLLASARLLALHFCRRYAVPTWLQHEVYGEARVVVVRLAATHDPALSSWRSYLYGKGHWLLIDQMRDLTGGRVKNNRRPIPRPMDDDDLRRLIPAQRDGSEDVVERLAQLADLDRVRREMCRLTPREVHVIVQHFLHERSLADIAGDLDVTESRICQIKQQALRRLRTRLTA